MMTMAAMICFVVDQYNEYSCFGSLGDIIVTPSPPVLVSFVNAAKRCSSKYQCYSLLWPDHGSNTQSSALEKKT